ncbi:hypothetical protein D9619_003537 [Psilocybe cf. subviscida]|uniref:ditrans,polycis-polyprenyl diphosphate synthase [(2E,6E)-farnesyldiphosphate specific] n=1 Tax=Psilocybe cf. subviscida TaxID=2480587 RepID=A0A8H5EV10_9AGAR|nr:hypothetical protein D9619_003537 [Psilocybe cf. subviscida]
MRVLFAVALHVVHFFYAIFLRVHSYYTHRRAPLPQPLTAARHRIPKHLALVFVVDPTVTLREAQDALTESVLNAVEWCRTLGIQKLTVYEQKDMLSKCTESIREQLPAPILDVESSESETDYPLTPPPSDHSLSRPLSPSDASMGDLIPITKIFISTPRPSPRKDSQNMQQKPTKRRQHHQQQKSQFAIGTAYAPKSDLALCLISGEASKPAIAATARALAREESRRLQSDPALRQQKERQEYRYELSVKELEQILEDESGLLPPDFMIVHPIDCSYSPPAPPELHGFPPWHIRLTEIFQNYPREAPSQAPSLFSHMTLTRSRLVPIPLEELHFRAALDEFATAEMRFGK